MVFGGCYDYSFIVMIDNPTRRFPMTENMNSPTILIVEDNLPINNLFCKKLSAVGFSCRGVTTIDRAISAIKTAIPDLLILDFELPDGYGIQVLDFLNSQNIQIPTIIASASPYALKLQYAHYDISHVLVKPVSPQYLADMVKKMLCSAA